MKTSPKQRGIRFGGLQKTSLIDYPGKIGCVLFLSGCNFHCPYCHNPELVKAAGAQDLDESRFIRFLKKRKGFLDGVVISGGEPTLQNGLDRLCETIKGIGYSVKLDTNGSMPEVIQNLAGKKLVDYIAMDLKTDPEHYVPLISRNLDTGKIRESIKIIIDSGLPHEFRTTCVKPFVDLDIISTMAEIIRNAELYALQNVQNRKMLHPEFFSENNYNFTRTQMEELKAAADPFVKKCIIR